MIYNEVRQTGPNLYRVASSFTRPSDTTQYTADDLVANSTTAASVTPLSWTLPRTVKGLVNVRRAFIRKTSTSVTDPGMRVHLFSASPTVSTTGDNGVFKNVVTGLSYHLGSIYVPIKQALADGAVGWGVPLDYSETCVADMIVQPASGRIIYGLLSSNSTYTPASAEVFTVELEVERA